jgi:hypothetical protein
VHVHAERAFHAPKEAVVGVLADPAFAVALTLPDLDQPELLESTDDGDRALIRLRYEFAGNLDPMARRLLGSGRLAWIQEARVDRSTCSGTLTFEAERDPRRLYGRADFAVESSGPGSVRSLDGELVVAIPGIGRMAERRIVPGLLRRLDLEAASVDAELS